MIGWHLWIRPNVFIDNPDRSEMYLSTSMEFALSCLKVYLLIRLLFSILLNVYYCL